MLLSKKLYSSIANLRWQGAQPTPANVALPHLNLLPGGFLDVISFLFRYHLNERFVEMQQIAYPSEEIHFNILMGGLGWTVYTLTEVSIAFNAALEELICLREVFRDKIVKNLLLASEKGS